MKTYVTYCREHQRPINQEILRDHMNALNQQEKKQKLQQKQKQKQQHQHQHQRPASVAAADPPLYSDSKDCEEDLAVYEKKKRQRRRVPGAVTGARAGAGRRDNTLSVSTSRSDSSSRGGDRVEQRQQQQGAGAGGGMCTVRIKQGTGNGTSDHSSSSSSSAPMHAVEAAKAFLSRDVIPAKQKPRDSSSRGSGGIGIGEGSQACPVCLDSDSDGDGDGDGENLKESQPTTQQNKAGKHPSRRQSFPASTSTSSSSSAGRKRSRQSSGEAAMSSLKHHQESLPELVIPPGHYFDSRSGRCLKYTPFAINGLELEDLFGRDVFEEDTHAVLPSGALKSKEVAMHPNLSTYLKPHQKEAVHFMWKNVMLGVLDYSSEEEGGGAGGGGEGSQSQSQGEEGGGGDLTLSQRKKRKKAADLTAAGQGCVIAHYMGLGKTLSIISFLTTIM